MTPMRIMIPWICTVLCITLTDQVLAEDLPTLTIRYMTIEADYIVLGTPVDPKAGVLPCKYKVTGVLKGSDPRGGQEIVVMNHGIYASEYPSPKWFPKPRVKKAPAEISKVLLFLKRPTKGTNRKGYDTVLSGIRALTKNGQVLVPQQMLNPGPQYLMPVKGENWDAMLAQVRSDLPKIAKILKLRTIPDYGKRNKAIFEWIEKHKKEFVGGYFREHLKGWASLEGELFNWLMESCIPKDCWRAIELSIELDTQPTRTHPSFCSPQGRELLMAKVFDKKLSGSMRIRALRELGNSNTYWWHAHRRSYPGTSMVTPKEQEKIIRRITPFLGHTKYELRAEAVRCLMSVSLSGDANYKHLTSKLAIPDLTALYKTERHAAVRSQLENAIFWYHLSGNRHGIEIFLRFLGIERGAMEFRVDINNKDMKFAEAPVLCLEKLNSRGKGAKTHTIKLAPAPPEQYDRGWRRWRKVIPLSKTGPGPWRVVADVRAKKEEIMWRSDPVDVTIPEPASRK